MFGHTHGEEWEEDRLGGKRTIWIREAREGERAAKKIGIKSDTGARERKSKEVEKEQEKNQKNWEHSELEHRIET